MADVAKELNEKRVALANEIRSLADQQDNWDAEQRARWDTINAEYDDVEAKLEAIEERQKVLERRAKIEEHDDRIKSARKSTVGEGRIVRAGITSNEQRALAMQAWLRRSNDKPLLAIHEQACSELRFDPSAKSLDIKTRPYAKLDGFGAWDSQGRALLDGFNDWREEQRALTTAVSGSPYGGYTIPEGFSFELERVLLAFGGPRRVCRVHATASGNAMPWPVVNDTTNTGEILAESGSIGNSVDPVFSQISFGAYKFSSKPVLVSSELLEDSAFNLLMVIAELLGERIGRSQAAYFTTGTGSSQPQGIVTGSAAGKTAAAATSITSDELIDLQDSLDPAYESGTAVGWMMGKSTKSAIRKLKDGNDQYLWQPGLRFGEADLLLGRPITINQSMADIEAEAKPIIYGDFSKFVIRDAAELRFYQLTELYRATDTVGFVAFRRSDSKILNSATIRHLVMAAS